MKKLRKIQVEGFEMTGLSTASDNEIDDYVMKKLRKIQVEGFEMPGLATASDHEIDDYVMKKLRKIQVEGFEIPGLATTNDSDISHFVMENLCVITTDRLDTLTDGLIQCLSLCHRLQNFRYDIPAWLVEIDNFVTAAQCNKFQRGEHILTKFGIHTEIITVTYHTQLNQSCGKAKPNSAADHIKAKIGHLKRNAFPLEDLINKLAKSTSNRSNDGMLTVVRSLSSITPDLLFIDRICTYIYWTVMLQKRHARLKLPKE